MATANTKRQSYTTAEKLKVIQFAEQHGNRSAQREFDIAEIKLLKRRMHVCLVLAWVFDSVGF